MSFREQVADEVKEAASSNEENDEQESVEQLEVDLSETPFVKFTPTTMVTGTFPENEGNPVIRFPDEDNEDGRRDQGYLGLILDDVTAESDEFEDTIILDTEDDSTDYRFFDGSDDATSVEARFTKDEDGNPVEDGVEVTFDGRTYKGHEVDAVPERSIVVVDGTAAVSIAKRIDVNGAVPADMDDETGQPNGGLIEYAPDDEDVSVNRRYARNPEVRDDLLGERIGVMVSRREEQDEDYAARVADNDDPARAMYWYSAFTMDDGTTIEPTEGKPVGYSFLEWNFDPTAGHLPDDQWTFVQEYQANGLPTEEETIIENVEQNEFDDDPNTDRIVRLIQNEAGQ